MATVVVLAIAAGCSSYSGDGPESALGSQELGLGTAPGTWVEVGPGGITNGSTTPPMDVAGAVHRVVADPVNANTLYAGTVNGGVWRTTNGLNAHPTWAPLTDTLPSLSISALAMDPTNSQQLAAGTGGTSSFFGLGGTAGEIYTTTNGGSTWTVHAGIVGQSVSGIAVRGTTVLVGTRSGSLFQSTNSGATFTARLTTSVFWDLVADPSNGTRYYAAGQAGVFRSTDAGGTWTNVTSASPALAQALQSSDNARMAVGQDGRIFIAVSDIGQCAFIANSSNQGASWTSMDLPRYPTGTSASPGMPAAITNATNATPIVITTAANHNLFPNSFVTGRNLVRVRISGVLGNTNANGDWLATPVAGANPPPNQFVLLNRITAASSVGNGAYTPSTGTWQQWFALNTGGQGGTHLSIAVDPTISGTVYVGGDAGNSFATTGAAIARGNADTPPNNGIPSAQWAHEMGSNAVTQIPSGGTASFTAPHSDSRHMTFDASGNLLYASDGGIFRRTSPRTNTGDWGPASGSLGDAEIHDIAFDSIGGVFFGGTQDNGTAMQGSPGAVSWNMFEGADGGDVQVDTKTLPGQSIRYSSAQGLGTFLRTTFTGNVQGAQVTIPLNVSGTNPPQNLYQVDPNLPFTTRFALNHVTPTRLVIGASVAVFESSNQGDIVTSLQQGGNANDLDFGHPNNANALWAATSGGVFVRFTGAGTAVAATPTAFPPGQAIDVIMAPNSERHAYVIGGSQIFETTDGGTVWTDVTGDLQQSNPGFLRTIQYVPNASQDRLVVGADNGVFVGTVNPAGFWSRLGTNLPQISAFDLDYNAGADQLVAGTLGRGAWKLASASLIDLPPVVKCHFVQVIANDECLGILGPPGIDNGSFDPEGQPLTCTQTPPSPYSLGITLVTDACSDPGGATNSCTAAVNVVDQTKPSLTAPPAITISTCTNANIGNATAFDNCGATTITNDAPAKFPLGPTLVTWRATDGSGNFSTATQVVTAILSDDASCCPTGTNIIIGTNAADNIVGTSGSDCILGRGGDDTIDAGDGDDFVSGGAGNDTIAGGPGDDFIFGGTGNDTISSGTGNDFVDGDGGTDTCSGGTGTNTIIECESVSFCTASCCATNSCGVPNPPTATSCRPPFMQSNCLTYVQGTIVSSGGDNWRCANGNCANCATFTSCFPGASGCPFGTVWTNLGVCH